MRWSKIFAAVAGTLAVFMFFNCGGSGSNSIGTGTLSLRLADAPLIDDGSVTGVYITITGIEYHTSDGSWKTMDEFNTSVNPINLLEWQDGKSISLGDFQLPAGKYTQMRFMLDAAEEQKRPKSNTGCFIEINDVNETLYVPSGSQTGYKAVGNYEVPRNGTVVMTADFNVRKSIVSSGDGSYYKLKPTIKLVVTNEAGTIKGTLGNLDTNSSYVVYAYEYVEGSSTWNDEEANEPAPEEVRFANAVTSSQVKDGGAYMLTFLAAGTYDLIVAKYDGNGDYETYYIQTEITVESAETTTFDWTL
ncbi:DUF4382 domain-containing protein [Sulfurimonas sp. HSL3-7]|uniref:DUF4382 domain-containing protein n=1 Tax=Sulfonitrofixus jiaomeiensis TaxID=3131938 RepID=UPI0031F8AFEE